MTEINWPKLLCPHCGNREAFEFEIVTRAGALLDKDGRVRKCPHDGSSPYSKPAIAMDCRCFGYAELPFNSKVWCLKCGEQGRWNDWMRGAYEEAPRALKGDWSEIARYEKVDIDYDPGALGIMSDDAVQPTLPIDVSAIRHCAETFAHVLSDEIRDRLSLGQLAEALGTFDEIIHSKEGWFQARASGTHVLLGRQPNELPRLFLMRQRCEEVTSAELITWMSDLADIDEDDAEVLLDCLFEAGPDVLSATLLARAIALESGTLIWDLSNRPCAPIRPVDIEKLAEEARKWDSGEIEAYRKR